MDRGRREQRGHPDGVPLAHDSGRDRCRRAVPNRCHGAAPDPLRGVVLWRVPWLAFCTLILAVLVALFAPIELRRSVLRPVERGPWRDGATVLGLAAVVAGLLGVAVSGPDYHGPTRLPWGAVILYLSGAAVLRVVRTRPARPAAIR